MRFGQRTSVIKHIRIRRLPASSANPFPSQESKDRQRRRPCALSGKMANAHEMYAVACLVHSFINVSTQVLLAMECKSIDTYANNIPAVLTALYRSAPS